MPNDQNTSTLNLHYPTDYNIKSLNLITNMSGDGSVNLLPFFLELNLFEDLYGTSISGEIILQDAMGLISSYGLNGTEFLQVELQKTSLDEILYSRNFRVYKLDKRVVGDTNNYEVYALKFCSEELLVSEQYRISKSFKGEQISNIVRRISQDYLYLDKNKSKPFNIEETVGVYDFVLPNKKIFETINWLTNYAQTTKSVGDVIFFENSKGYFFTSLSTLFERDVYASYKFDQKNISNDMNQKVFNATDLELLDFFDTLRGISNGTFVNKVMTLDILQRKVNTTDGVFKYSDYVTSPTSLNDNTIINNYKNRLGGTMYNTPPRTIPGLETGCLRLVFGNKSNKTNKTVVNRNAQNSIANDIFIEKTLSNRVSKLSLSNYMRIKITIPGDPNITVGRTVNFSTYKIEPSVYTHGQENAQRELDPFYTGKYIVSAVRHVISPNSYRTFLELSKDSNMGNISGFDNNSVILKQYVDGKQL